MRVAKTSSATGLTDERSLARYVRDVDRDISSLYIALQGKLRFGEGNDGNPGENIDGEFIEFTTSATPDAENTVAHTLDSIPKGFIVMWQDKAGSLYQGPTTGTNWTADNIYVKSDVASVTFNIFLLR